MTIAKIQLDEGAKLKLGMSITGAGGIPESRFIIENKDFSVSLPCQPTNDGVEVNIRGMDKMFMAGTYDVRLEVVLENKLYTPLRDKIEFEPAVSVISKSNTVTPIAEEAKISVTTEVINEDILRRVQAATIIAQSLHYTPKESETPTEIINHALEYTGVLTLEQKATLDQMLTLAESVGIDFDHSYLSHE